MGKDTGISWCDHTFNVVIGCAPVSPGCAHCYARDLAKNRMGLDVWDDKQRKPRKTLSDAYWKQPFAWNWAAYKEGRYHRVFCSSMADVFEDHPTVNIERERLWPRIYATPWLDWLLLTKRPENVLHMVPEQWRKKLPENIWIGTSAENQRMFERRIEPLIKIPAKVRFLSCEPLLGYIDLFEYLEKARFLSDPDIEYWRPISWVIVGGESGPKHRPMNLQWARDIRDQCQDADVPFFFKQVGGMTSKSGGHLLDGVEYQKWPPFTYRRKPMHENAW